MSPRRFPIPTTSVPRAGRRRRRLIVPKISKARLIVEGDVATFIAERELLSENRLRWSHWSRKHKDRNGWEATLKNALVFWIEERARAAAKLKGVLGELVRGEFPRAPEGRYRVEIERVVPYARNLITDLEDNLAGGTKPILDALVSLGVIFSDRSKFVERPLPTQRIEPGVTQTIIRVSPFWRARASEVPDAH